jgi:hypothetical protein
VLVYEKALDDWIGQLYGASVFKNEIPKVRPAGMPDYVYQRLRKYVKYDNKLSFKKTETVATTNE